MTAQPEERATTSSTDVLFVSFFDGENPIFSFGIASLSAVLRRHGFTTALHVVTREETGRTFVEAVQARRPRLLAFQVFSRYWPFARELINEIKKVSTVPVVAGGPHATFCPGEILGASGADFACVGEGEQAVLELLQAIVDGREPAGIANIYGRSDFDPAAPVRPRPLITSLDELPFADRSLFRTAEALALDERVTGKDRSTFKGTIPVLAGRGCPYRCTYCSNEGLIRLYGVRAAAHRRRSPEAVADEALQLHGEHPDRALAFYDEVFPTHPAWLEVFADRMSRGGSPPFVAMVRCEQVKPEALNLLRRAGCFKISMGVECGSEEFRRHGLGRNMTNAQIRRAFDEVHRAGLETMAFVMIGLPFETDADVDETISLVREIKAGFVCASIYRPLPGSSLFSVCKEHGLIVPYTDRGWHDPLHQIVHRNLSPKKLIEALLLFGKITEADLHLFANPAAAGTGKTGSGKPSARPHGRFAEQALEPQLSRQVEQVLPAGWRILSRTLEEPYYVVTVTDGSLALRIGVTEKGAAGSCYLTIGDFDISYLTDDPDSLAANAAGRKLFEDVISVLKRGRRKGPAVRRETRTRR
jgi:anaerobic magnesium-protoporphyrin IX monomethyl ester cyclase